MTQNSDYPDHHFPMNRWFVSNLIRRIKREDFIAAVTTLHQDIEDITGRRYNLQINFYRAATPDSRPAIIASTHTDLKTITARHWREAAYAEAQLAPHSDPAQPFTFPVKYAGAKITTGWPDTRRIDFEVQPATHGREISRRYFDKNCTYLTRGYDPQY